MKLLVGLAMLGTALLGGISPAQAANECVQKCRQELNVCQRAGRMRARDCAAPCREARLAAKTTCPGKPSLENCPALAQARTCMTECRKKDKTESRACGETARKCRDACPKVEPPALAPTPGAP